MSSIDATRRRLGIISFSSSIRFACRSITIALRPVTLPPGRARLATRPVPTGLPEAAMTIGIVAVACLAAIAASVPLVMIKSTSRRINSVARSGKAIIRSLGRAVFDNKVVTFDISEVAQTFAQSVQIGSVCGSRNRFQHADTPLLSGLLRLRHERPRHRTAEQRYELATFRMTKL